MTIKVAIRTTVNITNFILMIQLLLINENLITEELLLLSSASVVVAVALAD